jgi:uncharacterized protein
LDQEHGLESIRLPFLHADIFQLMLASYHGHAALARLLIQHGADPNRLNDRGQSILAGVVFKNEPELIDILLEAGADPEIGQPTALDSTRVS